MNWNALLREPLVHFFGIGAGLFLLYSAFEPDGGRDRRIVISEQSIAELKGRHENLWGRQPTKTELTALVSMQVRNEILYREGLEMGLDLDDEVIKRRIRQKYEIIAEEENSDATPTDAALSRYLKANIERFIAPPVLSFQQVMAPIGEDDKATDSYIKSTLPALRSGASPTTQVGSKLLPSTMNKAPLDLVARDFGSEFAAKLASAPTGQWIGPYTSGYGVHLVRVVSRVPGKVPSLREVRSDVAREWENNRRALARDARMAELHEKYRVVIEGMPEMARRP